MRPFPTCRREPLRLLLTPPQVCEGSQHPALFADELWMSPPLWTRGVAPPLLEVSLSRSQNEAGNPQNSPAWGHAVWREREVAQMAPRLASNELALVFISRMREPRHCPGSPSSSMPARQHPMGVGGRKAWLYSPPLASGPSRTASPPRLAHSPPQHTRPPHTRSLPIVAPLTPADVD